MATSNDRDIYDQLLSNAWACLTQSGFYLYFQPAFGHTWAIDRHISPPFTYSWIDNTPSAKEIEFYNRVDALKKEIEKLEYGDYSDYLQEFRGVGVHEQALKRLDECYQELNDMFNDWIGEFSYGRILSLDDIGGDSSAIGTLLSWYVSNTDASIMSQ